MITGKMFVTTGKILDAYENNTFAGSIVYGELGIGKSSFGLKTLCQLYDIPTTWAEGKTVLTQEQIDIIKNHIVYRPEEFMHKIKAIKEREMCLVWDDAGVTLFNLDTWNPFIKLVTKYFSVARTNLASIIFTSPSAGWIVKKIRGLQGMNIIKITRADSNNKNKRIAQAYKFWTLPDGVHTGVKRTYQDEFNVMLPDNLYAWYEPYRKGYVKSIEDDMFAEWERQKQRKGYKGKSI